MPQSIPRRENPRSGRHPGRGRWGFMDDRGRRHGTHATDLVPLSEKAENKTLGACRARREQPTPPFSPKRLSDLLVRRPSSPAGTRNAQTDSTQPRGCGEISDFEPCGDLPHPEVPRHLVGRRDSSFGKVSIRFGPHREFSVSEIKRIDRCSSLPSIIWRRLTTGEWINTMDRVSKPPV